MKLRIKSQLKTDPDLRGHPVVGMRTIALWCTCVPFEHRRRPQTPSCPPTKMTNDGDGGVDDDEESFIALSSVTNWL